MLVSLCGIQDHTRAAVIKSSLLDHAPSVGLPFDPRPFAGADRFGDAQHLAANAARPAEKRLSRAWRTPPVKAERQHMSPAAAVPHVAHQIDVARSVKLDDPRVSIANPKPAINAR
jgi:hypothetical protein